MYLFKKELWTPTPAVTLPDTAALVAALVADAERYVVPGDPRAAASYLRAAAAILEAKAADIEEEESRQAKGKPARLVLVDLCNEALGQHGSLRVLIPLLGNRRSALSVSRRWRDATRKMALTTEGRGGEARGRRRDGLRGPSPGSESGPLQGLHYHH